MKSKGLIKIYFDGYLVEHLDRLRADVYLTIIPENVSFISIEIKNNPERAFIVSSTDGLIKTDKRCTANLISNQDDNLVLKSVVLIMLYKLHLKLEV